MMTALSDMLDARCVQAVWHESYLAPLTLATAGAPGDEGIAPEMLQFANKLPISVRTLSTGLCSFGALAGMVFPADRGHFSISVLLERWTAESRNSLLAVFDRTFPMLGAFFALFTEALNAARRNTGLAAAVDSCDIPTIVLDPTSRIVFANSAADTFLETGKDLLKRRGRLGCNSLADTLKLQAAIEHLGSAHKQELTVVTLARSRQRPLMISLTSALGGVGPTSDNLVIACVFDPQQDISALLKPICRYYGLSVSEARLACRLVAGGSLCEAAKSLGIREQTARSYLKQIFLKTETNRQAELVGLLVNSAVHVRGRDRMVVI